MLAYYLILSQPATWQISCFYLNSSTERDRLIAKGQKEQTFSWDKTVAQTVDVYRSVSGIMP